MEPLDPIDIWCKVLQYLIYLPLLIKAIVQAQMLMLKNHEGCISWNKVGVNRFLSTPPCLLRLKRISCLSTYIGSNSRGYQYMPVLCVPHRQPLTALMEIASVIPFIHHRKNHSRGELFGSIYFYCQRMRVTKRASVCPSDRPVGSGPVDCLAVADANQSIWKSRVSLNSN